MSATATEEWNIFKICHTVETISPQVQTYRDQVQHLEKLAFDKPQIQMCKETKFAMIPLRYLYGVLHFNFQLLWEPTLKIIASHAHSLEVAPFWEVFMEQMKIVSCSVDIPHLGPEKFHSKVIAISNLYEKAYELTNKPDLANCRLLLWKGMTLFPDIAAAKTRDTSQLFLDFIE